MIISADKALKHEVLSKIIEENVHIFKDDEETTYNGCAIVCLFILYEITKLTESYWYPFLRKLPIVRMPCLWKEEEILAI